MPFLRSDWDFFVFQNKKKLKTLDSLIMTFALWV